MPRVKYVKPHVIVYAVDYEWCGDEGDQWADGDLENAAREIVSCVPDRWDREDGKTLIDLAADVLNDQPAYLEPDVSPGIPSWFGGSGEPSYRDGTWVEYSVHFEGFGPRERTRILEAYNAMKGSNAASQYR